VGRALLADGVGFGLPVNANRKNQSQLLNQNQKSTPQININTNCVGQECPTHNYLALPAFFSISSA
jgi:hypothetical protein